MTAAIQSESRFESDAGRYAGYLATPEGRLRTDLTLANLEEFLPAKGGGSLRALDLGCGTGIAGIHLARFGIHATLLDSSSAMLELAERASAEAGVRDKITVKHGDAADLAGMFQTGSFDIIVCHNLLEYVDDPSELLCGIARLLRNSSTMISVLVRNQAGEVLKAALKTGDLAAAEQNLTSEWATESLYGGKVRLFTPERLEEVFTDASLTVKARRGVRVIADYLPSQISRSEDYELILALERKLGRREEFFGMARYLQYLVTRQ